MNVNQKITACVLFGVTSALLIYDTYAYTHAGLEATISWVIYSQSMNYPIIPFGLGVLMGHFFGQMRR